jgi:hypothetical protein
LVLKCLRDTNTIRDKERGGKMCNRRKNRCLGCIKLDLMALCEDNEIMRERIRSYFESPDIGGY